VRGSPSVAFVLVALALSAASLAGEVEEPLDYRREQYRAPTPAALTGAITIDTSTAEQLWRQGSAVFVDVMPHDPRPVELPARTVWRERRRDNIPGSVWLVNVGYGALSSEVQAYFQRSLYEVTAGDRGRAVVFYCQIDCWMSWNAAKRALAFGYLHVLWYPDGTDGWSRAGLPLTEARPRP
jgi:PQQ-dependent catabolism-associated CXXCW motif protein